MSRSAVQPVTVSPMDVHNQTLVANLHPPGWVNPKPAERYDLVVIGAGTAGLVTAAGAAGLGAKVALIEKHLLGGDCLNVGCVPSKSVIRASRVYAEIRDAQQFGIRVPLAEVEVDFPTVMARMRRLRASISPHDSVQRFQKLGVDVFLGKGHFSGANTVEVAGETLRFKKAVIATGARAAHPAIEGLSKAGYLNNETVFSLTERPQRLAVIGGGPIGCELAQAFRRLGCQVVLFHQGSHILDREDAEAAGIVQEAFFREGIQLVLSSQVVQVSKNNGEKLIKYKVKDQEQTIVVDEILVGAGRAPNVESLNLEAVNVKYDQKRGVQVNDYLQTTNPRIYAAGDICMDWKFTHAADAAARIVIKNTLFSPLGLGRSKLSSLVMPWATYTDPEIAHVGLYEHEAQQQGIAVSTIKIPFNTVDRAITDSEEAGFVKVLHKQGSDQIVGATIVARHAGELISEITLAMVSKRGLNTIAGVIHPYPTQAEAIKKAADAYRRTLLTPRTQRFLKLIARLS
ncbi:mercuric reductase [Leptolyngbya sp. FACHB-261]|uniref:mercuric reductase n=1 Tax=Leptolyngbya sp. FACHB-261 TaxID=2692806 RepID=UPI001685D37F|nr:mercuric reductase [Leptolyngbya sp. FACHB-261]MBD2101313.1 mercuric reductase [Leptolyngbya sp. FACHB-261]